MGAASARSIDVADQENERLAALDRLDILDTGQEEAFDRIARLIKLSLGVETSIVSLIDSHRQWYKAAIGTPHTEVPIEETFCRVVLRDKAPLLVGDASEDIRFRDNPHVTAPAGVRFYASVPITTREGHIVGTICAIDSRARQATGNELSILADLAEIAVSEMELRQLATIDGLTGVATRRAFREEGNKHVALARRHRGALSLVSIDVDHFKSINDTYGHAAGDRVLTTLAQAVREAVRQTDIVGRIGGEEFALLLPHTDRARAQEVAEKLRTQVRALRLPGMHPPINVSASFGVATLDPDRDDMDGLLQKADEALYDAKRNGRNRVTVWHPAGVAPQGERRRVLKAGKLVYNNRRTAVDCTVRALWQNGAELQVAGMMGIPDEFALIIRSDNAEMHCRIAGRGETRLTVEFIPKAPA